MDINWPQVWTLTLGVGFGLLIADVVRWLIGLLASAVGAKKQP